MDAAVLAREVHADELTQLGFDARAAAVRVSHEVAGRLNSLAAAPA